MKEVRIVFMGTPEFAVAILKNLVEAKKNVVGVITAPDRPAGRGQKMLPSAVKEYALAQNIKVLQPTNLKDGKFLDELKQLHGNLQIVVAFRMLPKVVWQLPELGTFNLHASLLPQYRGAAPINWAIINGETETGVTTFFIDAKIDTGAIILQKKIKIEKNETMGSLHDTLMQLGCETVLETVNLIEMNAVNTILQPPTLNLKPAPKLTPENTRIDWGKTSIEIENFINGLSPYPTAWTMLKQAGTDLKVKIYKATTLVDEIPQNEIDTIAGSIKTTKKEIHVATKKGYLNIEILQLPNRKKMDSISLLNGFNFGESDIFS